MVSGEAEGIGLLLPGLLHRPDPIRDLRLRLPFVLDQELFSLYSGLSATSLATASMTHEMGFGPDEKVNKWMNTF